MIRLARRLTIITRLATSTGTSFTRGGGLQMEPKVSKPMRSTGHVRSQPMKRSHWTSRPLASGSTRKGLPHSPQARVRHADRGACGAWSSARVRDGDRAAVAQALQSKDPQGLPAGLLGAIRPEEAQQLEGGERKHERVDPVHVDPVHVEIQRLQWTVKVGRRARKMRRET